MTYSVSYYVFAERYWQFVDEYSSMIDVPIATRAMRSDPHGNRVRIHDQEGVRYAVGK